MSEDCKVERITELEEIASDFAILCYAPPEYFEINGGAGKGVCGTCDLGQDPGMKEHSENCTLAKAQKIWEKRQNE